MNDSRNGTSPPSVAIYNGTSRNTASSSTSRSTSRSATYPSVLIPTDNLYRIQS